MRVSKTEGLKFVTFLLSVTVQEEFKQDIDFLHYKYKLQYETADSSSRAV